MRRSYEETDLSAAMDRQLFREHSRMTSGSGALHALDPSEMVMRLEEFDPVESDRRSREELRAEIFSGFAEFLFAEGPAPGNVQERIEGFFRSFHPELADSITGEREWVAADVVRGVLKRYEKRLRENAAVGDGRGALSTWVKDLDLELDQEYIRAALVGLIEFLVAEGRTWRLLVATAYCLAKALRPYLIGGMSLDDIARLSGDAGRATPCDRVQRMYNRRLERAGFSACHVHFQKADATVRKYQAVQKGNANRKKNLRKSKNKTAKTNPRKP